MTNFWILSISIFAVVTFILAKTTVKKFRTESGEKMWKTYGSNTHYWKLLLLVSLAITSIILFILKWTDVVSF